MADEETQEVMLEELSQEQLRQVNAAEQAEARERRLALERAQRRSEELEGQVRRREERINELSVAVTELAHPESQGAHSMELAIDISDDGMIVIGRER